MSRNLVMNLLKTETKFKEFKYLIKQFKDDIYENMPESIFRINYDDVNVMYRDSIWKLLLTGECPVEFSELGCWWGNDPRTRSQSEIDIMGEADKNSETLM